jgi:transcriptional repressor of dcmA and dcmR
MTDNIEDLLTIKQAAKMLNVSEMSLRRWTNDGKLACLRVGAHRSRRFRRTDLVAFLEKQEVSAPSKGKIISLKPVKKAHQHVLLEGLEIEYGSHLCSFYDNLTGCQKLAVPLLADGLRNGEICFLIASPKTQNVLIAALKKAGCNFDSALKSGQILVSDGEPNKEAMLKFLQQSFAKATSSGNQAMRLVGDMSWALEKGWALDDILEYESLFNNTLGRQYPVVALCQYDVDDFSGKGVLGALRCHEDTFKYPLNRFLGTVAH